MKKSFFNAENMQGATGIDAFVTPPPRASTSFSSHVSLAPIETSISGNKAGDRAPASLWIRRLKPRDEPETLKRETFASDTEARHGLHIEKSDSGSSAHPFEGQATSSTKAWGNKALSKDKTLVDEGKTVLKIKWDSLNKIRQQSSLIEQQDYGGERQQDTYEQRRGVTPSPISSNSGFCQHINKIAGAKLEKKPVTKSMTVDMNVNSRYTSEPAVILQTCSQAVESKSQVSHAVKVQAEGSIPASSLGKPPLPPVHSKFGCRPRPTGHKSPGFSAWSTGWLTSSPANGKVAAMPSQDIIRYPSHIAVTKETLLASDTSVGPLFKEGCQVKADGLDCRKSVSKEDKIYTEDRRICPRTQVVKSISGSQATVPAIEPITRQLPVSYNEGVSSTLMCKSPKKISRQDLEAMDVVTVGTGSSKNLKTHENGNVRGPSVQPDGESSTAAEQPSSNLPKDNSMQKPPSECSAGPAKAEETMEATSSASTTANFPWEMFVEAAGPSKSAREEFVEVYNRARDELKNQKASSSIAKVSDKEMENHPGFASGRATCLQNTSIVMRGGQTPDRQLQPKILEKLKKVNRSVSQLEGANVTVINAQVPQEEQLSKRHHRASLLEGEVDIKSKQDLQAFQNFHVTSRKESMSFVWGQQGGPLHGYVEPPAVAHKNCSTLGKSSEWKQGFASSAAPERDIKDGQNEAPMLHIKRQRGIFESSPLAVVTGKESDQGERLPSRSDFWLQRWYPPHSSMKGVNECKLLEADRTRQGMAGCSTGNMLEVKKRDEHGACDKPTDIKQRLTQKGISFQRIVEEAEPKQFSEKVLPSAAAMAIVGTAARQFRTAQPQRKGSFSFWSGFGRLAAAPQTPDHFIEKGKRKLPFEAKPSVQP